jgi:hypothetical protein
MINETHKGLLVFVGVIVLVMGIYGVMTMRDQRSTTEKIGDAIHDLPLRCR